MSRNGPLSGTDAEGLVRSERGIVVPRRRRAGRRRARVGGSDSCVLTLDSRPSCHSDPPAPSMQAATSAIPWTSAEEARLAAAVRDYTLSRAARSGSSSDPHLTAHLHSPSSRDAWVAIKARFDASPDEAPRARSAASLAERWLHLEYTTGVHTTYRALAEAAIDHERAEWSRDEVGRLVGTVLALGGSAGRNAAGWEGEVEATSKWVQVWRAAGRGKTLVDVCLTWSEYRDVSRRAASVSPGPARLPPSRPRFAADPRNPPYRRQHGLARSPLTHPKPRPHRTRRARPVRLARARPEPSARPAPAPLCAPCALALLCAPHHHLSRAHPAAQTAARRVRDDLHARGGRHDPGGPAGGGPAGGHGAQAWEDKG